MGGQGNIIAKLLLGFAAEKSITLNIICTPVCNQDLLLQDCAPKPV